MSHQQSKADRTDAHRRRGGRPGGGAPTHQRDSSAKGSGGGAQAPSASVPVAPVNSILQPSLQDVPRGPANIRQAYAHNTQLSNAATNQPGRDVDVESTEGQQTIQQAHSQAGTRHLKQPPVPKPGATVTASAPKPSKGAVPSSSSSGPVESVPIVTKPAEDFQWKHPELTFQFGSFGPDFMHGSGIQIPARTSSAPPNLDEQKQEQARLNAAMPRVVFGSSGGQQHGIIHPVQPAPSGAAGIPNTHFSHSQGQHAQMTLVTMTTPVRMPAQVVASQPQQPGLMQLSYPQPTLQPQQGLMQHNPAPIMKFPQTMGPPLTGQMMGPLVTSLPGQLPGQQIPQLSHQLPPPVSGTLANQMQPGLPTPQYGAPIPNLSIPPRTSRAVKIVHPETHEELKFDFKTTKNDASAQASMSVNGSSQAKPPLVGYSSGLQHPLSMGTYTAHTAQQNGPLAPPYPQFYQASVPNPVPSSSVTLKGHNLNEQSHGQRGQSKVTLNIAPNMKSITSDASAGRPDVQTTDGNTSGSGNGSKALSPRDKKSSKPPEYFTDHIESSKGVYEQFGEAHPSVMIVENNIDLGKVEEYAAVSARDAAPVHEEKKEDLMGHLVSFEENSYVGPADKSTADVKQGSKKKKKKEVSQKAGANKPGDAHKALNVLDEKKQMDAGSLDTVKTESPCVTEVTSFEVAGSEVQGEGAVKFVNSKVEISSGIDSKCLEEDEVSMVKVNSEKEGEGCGVSVIEEKLATEEPGFALSNDEVPSCNLFVDSTGVGLDEVSNSVAIETGIPDAHGAITCTEDTADTGSNSENRLPALTNVQEKSQLGSDQIIAIASVCSSLINVDAKPFIDGLDRPKESDCIKASLNIEEAAEPVLMHTEEELVSSPLDFTNASHSAQVIERNVESKDSQEQTKAHHVEVPAHASLDSSGDFHTAVNPEVGHSSKKKRLKDALAKADAAGTTADLYNAYKAPIEKKSDESRAAKVPIVENTSPEASKPSLLPEEKVGSEELDDWEDAAELPTPSTSHAGARRQVQENGSLVEQTEVQEKYTRDFLLTFKDQNTDLPSDFEIRADIVESLINPSLQFVDRDVRGSGTMLDRQLSGGARRGSKTGSNFEEERWMKPSGTLYSSGRPDGVVDPRMWPGNAQGLIARVPPNVRSGIPMPPSFVPGKPFPSPMPPPFPGIARADSEKWERVPPTGQKGLIPSPLTTLPRIHKAEKRYEVSKASDDEESKQRQMKAILNKLTPQNFDKLFEQVQGVNIQSAITLTGVISQIFDKALLEPTFCEMYARFCVQLAVEMPEFVENGERVTFKRVLLNKCQEEFQRGETEQAEANAEEEDGEMTSEKLEEKRLKAKRRMLGNIRFIGELYKKSMLTERIMHECIWKLLGGDYGKPEEEDIEALCKLMSTIGHMIDHAKAKMHVDSYFDRMSKLSNNQKLSARLRFMLKDVIDLRRNGWQERRKVEGPKKIDEVHRDAVHERQASVAQAGRLPRSSMGASTGRRMSSSDYGIRGPTSSVYSVPVGNVSQAVSGRGGMRGPVVQDVHMEDRLPSERATPLPLSQRYGDEGPITLGPQGGLGRAAAMHGQAHTSQAYASEHRRLGPGASSSLGSGGIREETAVRTASIERPLDRLLLERPSTADREASMRGACVLDRTLSDRSISLSDCLLQEAPRPSTAPAFVPLKEDQLKKSESALMEYFSAQDLQEIRLCIEELRAPKLYPTMICNWVSLSFDKKDIERKLLVTLLVGLHPSLIKQKHILSGFGMVMEPLEDLCVDIPKAPIYISEMLARLVKAETLLLEDVADLLKVGPIQETGLGLDLITRVLSELRNDGGEQYMLDVLGSSGVHLEDFIVPKGTTLHGILLERDLLCAYQGIEAGSSVGDHLGRWLFEHLSSNEPVSETIHWLEHTVTSSMRSDKLFLRSLVTSVLRHCITLPNDYEKLRSHLKGSLSQYGRLLQSFAREKDKQFQYVIGMQSFVHELGHPTGLLTLLFSAFYEMEVISEAAFLKWQDDVTDLTPGREMALKDVYKWLMEQLQDGDE